MDEESYAILISKNHGWEQGVKLRYASQRAGVKLIKLIEELERHSRYETKHFIIEVRGVR